MIQVYCSATNTTVPTIRWEKGGTEIFQDPPHIFIRTSVKGITTSSVLTIDLFNSTDDGAYTCIATVGSTSASSSLLTLTSKTVQQAMLICHIVNLYSLATDSSW